MAGDTFTNSSKGLDSPADTAQAVDISSTDHTFTATARGIYAGVAGDVKVDLPGATGITFTGLAAGIIHPIRAIKVYKTGTTATNMVGVW